MKSLEFLKELQDSIEYLTRIDYVPSETREEVINSLINEYLNDDYKINAIKQDLEVLEILRKYIYLDQQCYDYDWEDGGCWIDYLDIKDIDDIDEHYQEDFKKIKQWLEENKNDN